MTPSTVAWFQCSSGIAGDMALGALLDAGADLDEVRRILAGLDLPGWTLDAERVERCGVAATLAVVGTSDDATERSWSEIESILAAARLPERVATRSHAALLGLATVEADLHGVDLAHVHLHEVGGHDAIIDVVGTMAALEVLGVDRVRTSPVGLGHGTVRSAHGTLPSPAPATTRLLSGLATIELDLGIETATPTGAAILSTLIEHVPAPVVEISSTGLGAGTRDLPGRANVVGVLVGQAEDPSLEPIGRLECNVDDLSGEMLGAAIDGLLAAGALDAWVTPIVMKKGRPAHSLEVLCRPTDLDQMTEAVHRLTGSLGVRRSVIERSVLERSFEVVELDGVEIRVKRTSMTAKPEFDDVLRAAEVLGRSPRQIEIALSALLED